MVRVSAHRLTILAVLVCAFLMVSVSGAFASGYSDWATVVAGNPANAPSPHGGYTSATNKCKVCHAVHEAAFGEVLLRSTVAEACYYCHVGPPALYTQVYGGNTANYMGTDLKNAHNWFDDGSGSYTGVTCNTCHQVHGATNVMTDNAYLTQKILKDWTAYPTAGVPLVGDPDELALTKWCDGCHTTLDLPLGGEHWANTYDGGSHVMGPANAVYGNSSATFNGRVAWKASTYCTSCHASGFRDGVGGFPHFTAGMQFLVEATSSVEATAPASDPTRDGVCLRCHRDATDGVGRNW